MTFKLPHSAINGAADLTDRQMVENGAAILDHAGPANWRETLKSKIDKLNVASMTQCPLGLLYGDFSTGWERLADYATYSAGACGFDTVYRDGKRNERGIKAAWEEYLATGSDEPTFTLSELRAVLDGNYVNDTHALAKIKTVINAKDPKQKKVSVQFTVAQLEEIQKARTSLPASVNNVVAMALECMT